MKLKSYRHKIYPDNEQKKVIVEIADLTRLLYNEMLKDRTEHYIKTNLWKEIDAKKFVDQNDEFAKLPPSVVIGTQESLDREFQRFFIKKKKKPNNYKQESLIRSQNESDYVLNDTDLAGFPKYRKDEYTKYWSVEARDIELVGSYVKLPGVGRVRIYISQQNRRIANVLNVTVLKESSGEHYLIMRELQAD